MRRLLRVFIISLILGGCLPACAQSEGEKPPLLVPTSGWLVGPATLAVSESKEKMPCVMMNQYDNGFSLRISGGDKKVKALAVDFHQSVFEPGKNYNADVWVGATGRNLEGLAFSDATLIVDTAAMENLYELLSVEKTMRLTVEGREFEFMLLGAADGLRRIEQCYTGGSAMTSAVPAREKAAAGFKTSGQQEKQAEMMPLPGADHQASPDSPSGLVSKAENKASKVVAALQGRPLGGEDIPKEFHEPPRDIMVAPQMGQIRDSGEKRWRVMHGARLHEILETWAAKENVELVWLAGQDFPVPKSVSIQGTFDGAVAGILEQYDTGAPRPVGRIYNDKTLGKKVLVVELGHD